MICELCKKEIDIKKERYTHVEDWEKEIILRDMWCHLECFNKAMNRDLTALEKQAKEMLDRAVPLFNQIAPKPTEEYII